MNNTFEGASVFNQYIGSWTTSGVTAMASMFNAATSFNQELSTWVVNPNVTACTDFDTGATAWVLARPSFTSCTI